MIEIHLPGRAYYAALEAGWPDENPRGAEALRRASSRRYGAHGSRWTAELERDDVDDLRDYLASVEGALSTCSAEELGETGYAELRALRQAIAHLEERLSSS